MDRFDFMAVEPNAALHRHSGDAVPRDTGTNKYDRDIPQDFHATPPNGGIDDWGC